MDRLSRLNLNSFIFTSQAHYIYNNNQFTKERRAIIMKLSENSLKLIKILNSSPEKLSAFCETKNFDDAFNYAQKLVPGYTLQEFKSFDLLVTKLKQIIASNTSSKHLKVEENELKEVGGGTFEDWMEIMDEYNKGYASAKVFDPAIEQLGNLIKSYSESKKSKSNP